jgi:hypothetical protein
MGNGRAPQRRQRDETMRALFARVFADESPLMLSSAHHGSVD